MAGAHCIIKTWGLALHPDEENLKFDETITTESRSPGFSFDQMVACEECLRVNPPTRMNCLYCGVALPLNEKSAALRRPTLRRLEEWEKGFNVICLPDETEDVPSAILTEMATLLRLDTALIAEVAKARQPLPLARAATGEEALMILERLRALGLQTETISDEELAVESSPPKRVRKLDLGGEELNLQSALGGESQAIEWAEVILFVQGQIFTKQIEVEEQRARPGAETEIVATRELIADETMLEIYTAESDGNWRIVAEGFDYSCLGEHKTLLAKDNFVTLMKRMRALAPAARFDGDYRVIRHLLDFVWPPSERTESRGLRRERPGKFNTEAAVRVSNEKQFTRYGRLCHLLERRRLTPST